MSRQYGPQTLAVGQRMTFPVGKNAANVYIRNRSPFILRVWFGTDAPSDVGPTTAWHADVGPWEGAPLGVLGSFTQAYRSIATYSNPAGFDGTVTIVPVTVDGSLQTTVSELYSVTLTSYEAAEAVPQPAATGTAQAITSSNQRVIALPGVPLSTVPQDGFFHFPAVGANNFLVGPRGFLADPAPAGNHFINAYLYSLVLQTRFTGWSIFSISVATFTAGGVAVNGVNLFGGIVDGGGVQGPQVLTYTSPYPLLSTAQQIGNDPNWGIFFTIFAAQNPGTNDFWLNATFGFDSINGGFPGAIGGFTQPPATAVPVNPATF